MVPVCYGMACHNIARYVSVTKQSFALECSFIIEIYPINTLSVEEFPSSRIKHRVGTNILFHDHYTITWEDSCIQGDLHWNLPLLQYTQTAQRHSLTIP